MNPSFTIKNEKRPLLSVWANRSREDRTGGRDEDERILFFNPNNYDDHWNDAAYSQV
jgi:hypothetical protein